MPLPGRGIRQHRLFDLKSVSRCANLSNTSNPPDDNRFDAIYTRVATRRQIDDLDRQIETLQSRYPHARVFREVASGIDFRRPVLRALLGQVISGKIRRVHITNQDRLCRFAYDLLQFVFQSHGCDVVVEPLPLDPELDTELTDDVIGVMTMFAESITGARIGRPRVKRQRDESEDNPISVERHVISNQTESEISTSSFHVTGVSQPSSVEECDPSDAPDITRSRRPIAMVLQRMPSVEPSNHKTKQKMNGKMRQCKRVGVPQIMHGTMAHKQVAHNQNNEPVPLVQYGEPQGVYNQDPLPSES